MVEEKHFMSGKRLDNGDVVVGTLLRGTCKIDGEVINEICEIINDENYPCLVDPTSIEPVKTYFFKDTARVCPHCARGYIAFTRDGGESTETYHADSGEIFSILGDYKQNKLYEPCGSERCDRIRRLGTGMPPHNSGKGHKNKA